MVTDKNQGADLTPDFSLFNVRVSPLLSLVLPVSDERHDG